MLRTALQRLSLSVFAFAGAVACGGGGDSPSGPGPNPTPTPTVQSVTVSPGTSTLTTAGATATLTADVRLSNGAAGSQTPTWTSSSPSVATVSGGVVTAVASGTTTITAAVGTVTGTATVTVAIPTVQTISVTPTTATLTAAGQTTALAAEVRLSNGAVGAQAPTWASSNPAVATVSASGVVTAVASGTTSVTASIGTVSGAAAVTVAIPTVQTVTVTPSTSSLVSFGATTRLTADVRLSNGTPSTATPVWTSSNPAVATVNAGTVTAVSNGTAVITAAVGTVSGSATVTVAQAVASIRLLPADTVMKTPGQLRASALDARGNVMPGASLQYAALNPGIATVSASGLVTALTPGVARVRVSSGGVEVTSIVRSIANVTRLSDLTPLFEYVGTSGQRRARSEVSQAKADELAALMGQAWSYMETVLPAPAQGITDFHFTKWPEIWMEASPFCGGVYFANQDAYQACSTPTYSHWMVDAGQTDFYMVTRYIARQFMLNGMTRALEFPWFIGGYTQWLSGGTRQGSTIVGAPLPVHITDFRAGDSQTILAPLDTLLRTPNVRFFENQPQRTPVAVRQAQSALFIAFLAREYPTVVPTILQRIRTSPGATITNDIILQEIQNLTGRTLEQLNTPYLAYARSLQP